MNKLITYRNFCALKTLLCVACIPFVSSADALVLVTVAGLSAAAAVLFSFVEC
jgi:hypothetical protein